MGHNRTDISPRAISGSGGVGFLVKDHILKRYNIETIDNTFEGILWIKLTLKDDSSAGALFCINYLPPANSSRGNVSHEYFETLLSQTYMYYDGNPLIRAGDYNSRIGSKIDTHDLLHERSPIDTEIAGHHESFCDYISDTNSCVLNGRWMHRDNFTCVSSKGRSVVDYILVPTEQFDLISDFHVSTMTDVLTEHAIIPHAHATIPDHSLVTCTINMTHFVSSQVTASGDQTQYMNSCDQGSDPVNRRYNVNILPQDLFENERCRRSLLGIIESLEYRATTQDRVDQIYKTFSDTLHSEMDANLNYKDFTPAMKKRRRRSKPYWDENLAQKWTIARDAEKEYLSYKGNNSQRRNLRAVFTSKRDEFDKCLRQAQRRHESQKQQELHELRTDNPKEFWNQINNLGPGRSEENTAFKVKLQNGDITDDIPTVLNTWKSEFENLFNSSSQQINNDFAARIDSVTRQWEQQYSDMMENRADPDIDNVDYLDRMRSAHQSLNSEISMDETMKVLRTLKNGKAVGIDNIANEILKVPAIHPCLHKLYSTCFTSGIIPSVWYKAVIHPILKRGKSPLFPLSHRGISLMSCVCKAFSSILNNRITKYAEDENILAEEQNGFRRLRSCLDHIYALTTIIKNRKLQGLDTYCCFVDFAKAFDSVHYPFLWHKLMAYGIHGSMLNVIRSMYSNLQSCVRVNGRLTEWFDQTAGVRQGDTLAPTLFALYINDLASEINALGRGVTLDTGEIVSILMYADDIVLISDSAEGLQCMLEVLGSWSADWKLGINFDKTNVVHFRRPSTAETAFTFELNGQNVKKTASYRYLGLDLHHTLDFEYGAKILNKAASKSLGALTAKYIAMNGLTYEVFKKLYDSVVVPAMDYSSEVWGARKYTCNDSLQHRAMRTFLGVRKCTPIPFLYGELKWISPSVRHKCNMARYWCKLESMSRSRLTRRIYEWDRNLALRGKHTWSHGVKQLFDSCGIDGIFDRTHVIGVEHLLERIRNSLTRTENNIRKSDAAPMSRLSLYNNLNESSNNQELPIYIGMSKNNRSLISRLRSGTLPIAIELLRYRTGNNRIPQDMRLCKSCNSNSVENEFHFIFNCTHYTDIRSKHNIKYLNDPNLLHDELNNIFNDKKRTSNLAQFLGEALKARIS